MADHCTYTTEGIACPSLATHYVACSPYAPHVWNVLAEPTECAPGQHEHVAEFCLRHAGDVAHARHTRSRSAAV